MGTVNMKLQLIILFSFILLSSTTKSYRCPEYALDFAGADIEHVDHVTSWQFCGALCDAHKTCSHWTWSIEASDAYPLRCFLKSGEGTLKRRWEFISGHYDCNDSECYRDADMRILN